MNKRRIEETLNLRDPFIDFVPEPGTRLWGWNGTGPIFDRLIEQVRPSLIIEIGGWMGESTCTMAHALRKHGCVDTGIITIDTWLGSAEHWLSDEQRPHLELKNGYPSFYRRFMTNVLNQGHQDIVLPLPMPSAIAGQLLAHYPIKADLIYVDGSHAEADVFSDLTTYWPLLTPNGVMFGDDIAWPSVAAAVRRFSYSTGIDHENDSNVHWIIRKSAPRRRRLTRLVARKARSFSRALRSRFGGGGA
jgi:predicted O-methyltransferase YrrM